MLYTPLFFSITPEWEGNFTVPNEINSLIFLESRIVKDLIYSCVLVQEKSLCKLMNGGLEIFALPNNQFIVLYSEGNGLNTGQVGYLLTILELNIQINLWRIKKEILISIP